MMYVLGVVMAGGRGERLYPLTQHRAKPAVPFGGRYRIIDFVLSNFVNSGILSIYVVTQFKAQSLLEHLDRGWRATDFLGDHFITPVPAQMRSGDDWYQGTADSVYQNLYLLERHKPTLVAVFGADHIYRMNIRQMIEEHRNKSAEVTVAAIPVEPFTPADADRYGRLRANLRRRGEMIGPLDALIAAQALRLGATVVTHNIREFARVPGLHCEDWQTP